MTNEQQLWTFTADVLSSGGRIALLAVAADEKGSPGKQGFKLALAPGGRSAGTIGGGVMEYRLKEQYERRLRENEEVHEVRLLVHSAETKRGEPSVLSCAGSQTVCIVTLGKKDLPAVTSIVHALESKTPARMVLSQDGLAVEAGAQPMHAAFEQTSERQWTYAENVGPALTAIIVGGGHVGNALSRILATLQMYVIVYDERDDLPIFRDNPYAHRKIADGYSKIGSYITEPEKTFAAVVTSDFTTDAEAVQQLLPLHLPYLGIMGVRAKMARIKNTLSDPERSMFEAQDIHAPIGVPIGSSTAEEIAVSIAAEMIAVKNRMAGK
jgi:xanthine dehydrogenase accessory factor